MSSVDWLLDAAMATTGAKNDTELAGHLGIKPAAVSNYRRGVSLPNAVVCATLAGLTGEPLVKVIGIVGEARAISREEKAVWRKLAGSVAILLCAIGLSGALPGKAHAYSVSMSADNPGIGAMPIMSKADWGWWAWLLRQWLAWRLRGSKPTNGSLEACQIA